MEEIEPLPNIFVKFPFRFEESTGHGLEIDCHGNFFRAKPGASKKSLMFFNYSRHHFQQIHQSFRKFQQSEPELITCLVRWRFLQKRLKSQLEQTIRQLSKFSFF